MFERGVNSHPLDWRPFLFPLGLLKNVERRRRLVKEIEPRGRVAAAGVLNFAIPFAARSRESLTGIGFFLLGFGDASLPEAIR